MPMDIAPSSSRLGWQLGLRHADDAWDELAELLAARGAEVELESHEAMLVATFEGEPELLIMDALGAWLHNLRVPHAELSTRRSPDEPWQPSWRAIYTTTQLSERLWVRPIWDPPVAGRVEIIIDPTNAFGGGRHPTTEACLAMLDRALATLPAPATVLDIGTGTGILAIAAAHLGANVVGVEIDEASCRSAERNAVLNGVADRVVVVHDTLRPDHTADVANVIASFVIEHAQTLTAAARHELILSGIQAPKEDAARAAYADLELVERVLDRGWVTLRYRHGAPRAHTGANV